MGICYSEIESKRFGLCIYRGQYEDFEFEDVQKIVNGNDFDIIIVRYPTSTIYEHYQLVNLDHCKAIHADSLVYYSAPLQEIEIKELRNDLEFEIVTSNSDKQLDSLVETIFSGYQNHYYANPCLPRTEIIEGYLEWAKSFALETAHGVTWLIKDRKSSNNVAFLACSFDTEKSTSELKLGGVMPECAGSGVYSDFVRYAQGFFKKMGIKTLLTSTQLQNIAVQRAWQKHGFRFDKSYETYHIVNESFWNAKMASRNNS